MKKILVLSVLVTLVLASCSTKGGYGCHGRESWGHMIKRINRP